MVPEFDPTNRELCPDDMCIGVIGSDGRCKECGTVSPSATTHSRYRGMDLDEVVQVDDDVDDDRLLCPDEMCIGIIGPDGKCKECGTPATAAGDPAPEPDPDAGEDDEDADRRLCPDGMCIGIIGPDGKCKECGTSADSGGS